MSKLKDLRKFEEQVEGNDNPFKKESKEKKERIEYTANFDGLCDLVLKDGEVNFLFSDGSCNDNVTVEGKTYSPPNKNDLDYLLPDLKRVYSEAEKHSGMLVSNRLIQSVPKTSDVTDDTDDARGCAYCLEIYKKLIDYHKSISELPNDRYYDLLVLWDYHTYLIEKFNFSPIIYFFADRERGKTRTTKGLIYVARRGVMTETLREANIIRWGRDHRSTLLFDVKNFPKKLFQSNAEDLIYGRAERGVIASRVLYPEKGAFRDTVRFEVFGATVITSNKMIDDIGMSRTFMLEMRPSEKIFTQEPTPESGLEYREMLTGMRLAHMTDNFIQCEKEETGRTEDMLIGYRSMVLSLFPSKLDTYYEIKKIIKEQKKELAGESFEAQILLIIMSHSTMVEEGSMTLTYDTICSLYNENKKENLQLDPRSLGRITKAMGFNSKRNSNGDKRGIFYDDKLINRLKIIYGVDDEEGVHPQPSSVTSESSETISLLEDPFGDEK